MSTVRHFDAPHIVRYGMTSEEKGKTWMRFYRNGVCFEVNVQAEDVKDTPFGREWSLKMKERTIGHRKNFKETWDNFCDLVISQCLPLLQELAPNGKEWVTLRDYLHTPTYTLKMVTDSKSQDAVPEVSSGPVEKPAYESRPTSADDFDIPSDIPRIQARDLVVLDKEKDYRHPPHKVRMPDNETTAFFHPCNNDQRHQPSGVVSNPSKRALTLFLRLQALHLDEDVRIPRLLAIVEDESAGKEDDSAEKEDDSAGKTDDSTAKTEPGSEKGTVLIAGAVLQWIPTATRLQDPACVAAKDRHAIWHEQVLRIVAALHARGAVCGNINPYTIRIDASSDAWLVDFGGYPNNLYVSAENAGLEAADFEGVKETFEVWLPKQIEKLEAEKS